MKFLENWRVLVWVVAVGLALYFIRPNPFASGVRVRYVNDMELEYLIGAKIFSINNQPIRNKLEYESILNSLTPNQTIFLKTSLGSIQTKVKNQSGLPSLGIQVESIPKTNIKMGLDLEGGVRVLLKPLPDAEHPLITKVLINQIIRALTLRLNTYGLRDIRIIPAQIEDKWHIFAEISGITAEEAIDLLTTQGKFEAKINGKPIFTGQDIVMIYLDPQHSRVEKVDKFYRWSFTIEINDKAAQKFAQVTKDLKTIVDPITGESYLNESLHLYIDGQNVSALRISSGLKGMAYTTPMITGGASSLEEAKVEMKKMQSYFRYSLPVRIELVGLPTSIPPALGTEFIKRAAMAIGIAFIAVTGVLHLKYRDYRISLLILATALSEFLLTLGLASLINWNIDLAAIAGLIAAVGTGVNDQIVLTDDVLRGIGEKYVSLKKRTLEAMKIIFRSASTIIIAMIPLAWIGFGMLKGFAITTVLGLLVGILITRPGYAHVIGNLYSKA